MSAAEALRGFLAGRRVVALTGAGVSTDSGLPEYRGPDGVRRAGPSVTYQEFVKSEARRRRYWARSVAGFSRFANARPNDTHRALGSLEASGVLIGLITQNVDRLHHAAGSRRVVELHGALARVRCLACGAFEARDALQERLLARNPWLTAPAVQRAQLAPDGDTALDAAFEARFEVVSCLVCGGDLKPDVVFFGEGVPRHLVDAAYGMLGEADALVVFGTSLMVFSGYRFVLHAHKQGLPIAVVNRGVTRGDALATLKLDVGVAEALAPWVPCQASPT